MAMRTVTRALLLWSSGGREGLEGGWGSPKSGGSTLGWSSTGWPPTPRTYRPPLVYDGGSLDTSGELHTLKAHTRIRDSAGGDDDAAAGCNDSGRSRRWDPHKDPEPQGHNTWKASSQNRNS